MWSLTVFHVQTLVLSCLFQPAAVPKHMRGNKKEIIIIIIINEFSRSLCNEENRSSVSLFLLGLKKKEKEKRKETILAFSLPLPGLLTTPWQQDTQGHSKLPPSQPFHVRAHLG